MNWRFLTYILTEYSERIGKTKIRMLRDKLRTIQYIVKAIAYYNPLKFFMLISILFVIASIFSFLSSAALNLLSAFILGIGLILMSILSVLLGMLAAQLKQIMDK